MCGRGGCGHGEGGGPDGSGGGDDGTGAAGVGRRAVLRASAAGGAATALAFGAAAGAAASTVPAGAVGRAGREETQVLAGRLEPGADDFVHLPVRVPRGVREIAVSYAYDRPPVPPGTPGNVCDIGIFDERGTALGGPGFRGWSGGFRTEFAISAESATPGYLPGPVNPGTWHVVLGPYTVAPQGMEYRVEVVLRYGEPGSTPRPAYPPERAAGRGRAWYRGDCHLHTVHSDGRRTPEELVAAARAAGLDFVVSTEHNTTSAHRAFAGLAGDDLLVLLGEEVTTRNGHWLALGTDPETWIDWRYRSRDGVFGRFARQVRRAGGLVVPAHPHCPFVACRWMFGYGEADAVEVWNGPWTADDEVSVAGWDAMLVDSVRRRRGWVPAVGNSDAHREPQVVGEPRTVVLADGLERFALLEGIRAGRCWIAESGAVELGFSAAGGRGLRAGIGERLAVGPREPVSVRLEVSGAPGGVVRLVTDEGQVLESALPDGGAGVVEWRTTASASSYVRAEVRRRPAGGGASGLPGAMVAMTNPVFLGER